MTFALPLIGHETALDQLQTWLASGRLPHALLLVGAQGIGKRLMAEHIAQSILAGADIKTGEGGDAGVQAQLQADASPDYRLLAPAEGKLSIGVEPVRNALAKLSLSSVGSRRICIIDAADQLTPQAANVLLKTLEEPPAGVHFILVCHQLSKLLPTIISRCQRLNLQRLTEAEAEQVLELCDVDSSEMDAMLELAQGCPGVALQFGSAGVQLWQELKSGAPLQIQAHDRKFSSEMKQLLLLRFCEYKARQTADYGWSTLYQDLSRLQAHAAEYNLSASWVVHTQWQKIQAQGQV